LGGRAGNGGDVGGRGEGGSNGGEGGSRGGGGGGSGGGCGEGGGDGSDANLATVPKLRAPIAGVLASLLPKKMVGLATITAKNTRRSRPKTTRHPKKLPVLGVNAIRPRAFSLVVPFCDREYGSATRSLPCIIGTPFLKTASVSRVESGTNSVGLKECVYGSNIKGLRSPFIRRVQLLYLLDGAVLLINDVIRYVYTTITKTGHFIK
jgi:hypothetical protein